MKTKLSALIILIVMAVLAMVVLNAMRREIKPKAAFPAPFQEEHSGSTASEYQLRPAAKTRSARAPILENTAGESSPAKQTTAKEEPSAKEGEIPQEDTYKPRKYPDAEKMRQMQERGIVLY